MKNGQKYFGLFESCYKFNELSEQEQKSFLIRHRIYIEGKNEKIYNEDFVNPFYQDRSQNINFLGKDFIHENLKYTLNPEFINEIYRVILENFENGNLKIILERIKVLKLSFQIIEDESEKANFLIDTKKTANQDYIKLLSNKIFQDFHYQKSNDVNYKENVIKNHLRYDVKNMSDYIFGLANFSSFLTIECLYNFLRITEILKFCDEFKLEIEKTEIEGKSKGLDSSQKILLIEKLIKYADKWESTDERKKAFIISKIIDRNEDNIRKILAKSSKKHSEYSKKFICDIAIADDIINKMG